MRISNFKKCFLDYQKPFYLYVKGIDTITVRCSDNAFYRDTYDGAYCGQQISIAKVPFDKDGKKINNPQYETQYELVTRTPTAEDKKFIRTTAIIDYKETDNFILSKKELKMALARHDYFKKYILEKNTVAAVFFTGSYAAELIDTESDIDLEVLVVNKLPAGYNEANPQYWFSYKGKKIHWHVWSLYNYLKQGLEDGGWRFAVALPYLSTTKADDFIYLNNKYLELLSNFFSYADQLAIVGSTIVAQHTDLNLELIAKNLEKTDIISNGKQLYYLLSCALILNDERLLDYKNELLAIKRLWSKTVNNELLTVIRPKISWLLQNITKFNLQNKKLTEFINMNLNESYSKYIK